MAGTPQLLITKQPRLASKASTIISRVSRGTTSHGTWMMRGWMPAGIGSRRMAWCCAPRSPVRRTTTSATTCTTWPPWAACWLGSRASPAIWQWASRCSSSPPGIAGTCQTRMKALLRRDRFFIELMFPITWGGRWDYPYREAHPLILGDARHRRFGAEKADVGLRHAECRAFLHLRASAWNISAAIAISCRHRTWTASSATTPRGLSAFRTFLILTGRRHICPASGSSMLSHSGCGTASLMANRLRVASSAAKSLPAAVRAMATALIPEILAFFSGATLWEAPATQSVVAEGADHRPTCRTGTAQMSEFFIDPKFGRAAFGADPGSYHATRPGYPDWVFETLCERCRLAPGTNTFEIGPGTGTATRRLLDLGATRCSPLSRILASRLPARDHPRQGAFGERLGVRGCRH